MQGLNREEAIASRKPHRSTNNFRAYAATDPPTPAISGAILVPQLIKSE